MGDARELLPLPHDPFGSEAYRNVDGISSAERLQSLKKIPALYRDIHDPDDCQRQGVCRHPHGSCGIRTLALMIRGSRPPLSG